MKQKYVIIAACLLIFSVLFLTVAGCAGPEIPEQTTSEIESTLPTTTPADVTTAPDTTAATDTTEPESTPEETEIPEAGLNSGVVRDGTPKKYFTIRFDDGITQDARIMEILRRYGLDCCTFYINTGLYGANWEWVGQQFKRPDVTHLRYTRSELASGIYNGFDVGAHTLTHESLKNLVDRQVVREVKTDANNIAKLTGYAPVGLAWPGGDTEWNERNVRAILAGTNIRYGSCTTRTGDFSLPTYFMQWQPTCGFSDGDCLALLDRFIAAEPTEDMLFFVWSHGYELDLYHSWDKFETMIATIAAAAETDDSIVFVTNAEFYQLFKDEIPSWKE